MQFPHNPGKWEKVWNLKNVFPVLKMSGILHVILRARKKLENVFPKLYLENFYFGFETVGHFLLVKAWEHLPDILNPIYFPIFIP